MRRSEQGNPLRTERSDVEVQRRASDAECAAECQIATGGMQRAALGFILVTVGLDMLAMAIVLRVLPKLVLAFLGGDTARGRLVRPVPRAACALTTGRMTALIDFGSA